MIAYDSKGMPFPSNVELNDDDVTAKVVVQNKLNHYVVKVNLQAKLYRTDKFYLAESYRIAKRDGLKPFKYIAVKQYTFDNYMSYLQTGNSRFLREAERTIC